MAFRKKINFTPCIVYYCNYHYTISGLCNIGYASFILWFIKDFKDFKETLYGGQFTLSTQLITLNYLLVVNILNCLVSSAPNE